jgi:hypothetical protein
MARRIGQNGQETMSRALQLPANPATGPTKPKRQFSHKVPWAKRGIGRSFRPVRTHTHARARQGVLDEAKDWVEHIGVFVAVRASAPARVMEF